MLDIVLDDKGPAHEAGLIEFAPAKINLGLHVVGQRDDGYHLLHSTVAFASVGDRLFLEPAAQNGFRVSGRFGAGLQSDQADGRPNLVLQARDLLRNALAAINVDAPPVAIHLEKNLPVAAGIGGGSADAAAALRGLSRLWKSPIGDAALCALSLPLGADIPMCLQSRPLLVEGIGEKLTTLESMPAFSLVLGNPLCGVSTPEIFKRLANKNNSPMPALSGDWRHDLGALRNDLEPVARSLLPQIGQLSDMIAAEGAWIVRMSGSGATCFGLFDTAAAASRAAANLTQKRPDWYFAAAATLGATR